jgi:hypothetical protein
MGPQPSDEALKRVDYDRVQHQAYAKGRGDLGEAVERLKLRAVSTFEHLTEDELAEGFARIEADLAAGAVVRKSATSDFLVFARDT